MRPAPLLLLAPALLLLAATCPVYAADAGPAPEIAAAQAALAGDDAVAKKTALRALSSKSVGKDAEVLPLLVAAIGDRQAGETAVSTLSSRVGKTPANGTYRPGLDSAKTQAAWQKWLEDWKQTQDLKRLEKKVEKNTDKPKEAVVVPGEVKPTAEKTTAPAPAEDLGKVDRIIFKAGSSLLCFIMSKRTDADGNLVSVRIVHPDGAGEETIAAGLISRIEEDIQ